MIIITKPEENDADLLAFLGRETFIQSHGTSASGQDIERYVATYYTADLFRQNMEDPKRVLRLLFYQGEAAGYSEILLDSACQYLPSKRVTKLNRLYLLAPFYSLNLGAALLDHNLDLAREHGQSGMWLYVWKQNERALRFYTKKGFGVVGSYDFKISETHSNPNHVMVKQF